MVKLDFNTDNTPELIFMYGYPASGKTTYAKKLVAAHPDKNYIYLGADEIRKELYGSQDVFGDSEKIYKILLKRMIECLKQGRNVVYDACNLLQQFRMDYLKPIHEANIQCHKILIRMNTTKETCLNNHANRNRNFDINAIQHYFHIDEYPTVHEGWEDIWDVQDEHVNSRKFYAVRSSTTRLTILQTDKLYEYLRAQGHSVTNPSEHIARLREDVETYQLELERLAFKTSMIDDADIIIATGLDYHTNKDLGWMIGYAFGRRKPILAINCNGRVFEYSAVKSFDTIQKFYSYNPENLIKLCEK